ncbi:hypothetical protein ABZ351_34750 [Streptomyces microflavus]|uniref:hypothetical protein n=1 Tax=Streptomyces microflavus TaxID=1919 RepID=UPI0033D2B6E0
MPEVMTSARTTDKPELEPVAHPECRICAAAQRGRSASRIHSNDGGVRRYNAIIEAHPHRGDQTDTEHQDDDQADADEDSPLMATLRGRVAEENGLRRDFRARVGP